MLAGLNTTYDDHLIIVGDAAGFIDPLTGEALGRAAARALHVRAVPAFALGQPTLAGLALVARRRGHDPLVGGAPCHALLCHPCRAAGEGIHTAMMGGKAAAEVLLACRQAGDYSKRSTRLYQQRWMELFGHDFKLVGGGASCSGRRCIW